MTIAAINDLILVKCLLFEHFLLHYMSHDTCIEIMTVLDFGHVVLLRVIDKCFAIAKVR